MNKNRNLIIIVLVFVLVIAGGAFAYNRLSVQVQPENHLQNFTPTDDNSPANQDQSDPQDEPAIVDSQAELPSDQPEETEPELQMAPDFTVEDAEGNPVKLSELFGKPIVLNFWASWCPPCKSEMPDFQTVYEELGEQIQFVMVDLVGGRETRESGEAYVAEQNFTFPVYYDMEGEAATTYYVQSIPTSYFINAEGYLVTYAQGMIDEETLRLGIDMLGEPTTAE